MPWSASRQLGEAFSVIVSTMSAGVSHVDLAAVKAAGARLGNTPGVLTDSTADLVLGLTLAVARRVVEAAAAVRSGEWSSWRPYWMTGKDLARSRCGIIGMGRIGEAVARRLRGFDCEVVYDGRSGAKPAVDARLGTRWVPREELLATSDFVFLLCALTPETRGMIGASQLRAMKPDAVFINASRGETVNQDELVAVMRERPLMRAGERGARRRDARVRRNARALRARERARTCSLPQPSVVRRPRRVLARAAADRPRAARGGPRAARARAAAHRLRLRGLPR